MTSSKRSTSDVNLEKYLSLYNNQINARALIGQSAVGYYAGKPTEKWRVFWYKSNGPQASHKHLEELEM